MPPTFSDLKTKMGDWLAVDTNRISDSVRGDCVNLSIRHLAREYDLWLGEKTGSLGPSDVGTFELAVPADFSRPIDLAYIDPVSGKRVYLKQRSWEQFAILYPNLGSTPFGRPEHYAQFGGGIAFGPPFGFVAVLPIHYYLVPADLTDALNTNLFTQYAWEAVFFRALVYATRYLIEDPRKNLWEELAREHELRLVIEHARARHSGGALVIEEPG